MKKVLLIVLAVALIGALLTGCGGSKGLQANTDYAHQKLIDFNHYQKRNAALYADELFRKATVVALMADEDTTTEDFEKIAHNLSIDSITIADENHMVTASYPEGDKGKKLKDLEDRRTFAKIIRNVATKCMTDPVYDEETGNYSLFVGVKTTDETGAVIIGLTTDKYSELNGDTLAEKCGNNMIVLKGDEVISSTLDGVVKSDTLDVINLTADDLKKDTFSFTSDGTSYIAKSATDSDCTVICAEPK